MKVQQLTLLMLLNLFVHILSVPSQAQELSQYQAKAVEAAKLELEITKITSSTASEDLLRSRLLPIYERLVENYCFPSMDITLTPPKSAPSADCLAYKIKLNEVLPESPLLICVDFGINSKECAQAYLDQYIIERNLDQDPDATELDAKLAELRNKPVRDELMIELNKAKAAFEANKNHETGSKVTQVLDRLIPMDCSFTQIKAEPKQPDEQFKYSAKLQATLPKNDPIREAYKKLEEKLAPELTPTPKASAAPNLFGENAFNSDQGPAVIVKKNKLWRVRYVTKNCNRWLKEARAFDPRYPTAVCYEQGNTTPDCFRARIWLRDVNSQIQMQQQRQQNPSKNNNPNFGTF